MKRAMSQETAMKRQWFQIARTKDGMCYFNGDVYTDLDEPLRLARRHVDANPINEPLQIWLKQMRYSIMLVSSYRTSKDWGEPVTEKMLGQTIWPLIETYARML